MVRETPHQRTPFGTRGCGRRLSLNRVENGGQLTPSQETVVLGFIGHAEFPTILEILPLAAILRGAEGCGCSEKPTYFGTLDEDYNARNRSTFRAAGRGAISRNGVTHGTQHRNNGQPYVTITNPWTIGRSRGSGLRSLLRSRLRSRSFATKSLADRINITNASLLE